MPQKHVLTLEQLKVYASPVRQRIVASLRARGSGSIAEVAADLERRPDSLYHHVRLLAECGLLRKCGERLAGKNREALYAPIQSGFSADFQSTDPAYLRAFSRLVRSVMADAATHFERAFSQSRTRGDTFFETVNVRLRPEQVDWFNEQLAQLVAKGREEADPDGERHLFTFVSCPVGKT